MDKQYLDNLVSKMVASNELTMFSWNSYSTNVLDIARQFSSCIDECVTKKNIRLFDGMVLRLEHFKHEYGDDHDITIEQAKMVAKMTIALIKVDKGIKGNVRV